MKWNVNLNPYIIPSVRDEITKEIAKSTTRAVEEFIEKNPGRIPFVRTYFDESRSVLTVRVFDGGTIFDGKQSEARQ